MMSRTDYQAALQAWQVAQQQFEQADPDHIDIAIYQLCAAERRLSVEVMKVKGGDNLGQQTR